MNETGTLTASKLEGAFALIVVLVDSMQPITTDEINVIKNWLATGNKLLWVAGDSDYGNDMYRQDTVNNLLKKRKLQMFIELCGLQLMDQ